MAALSPRDYNVIFGVFKSLAQAEWFDRNVENEKACALVLLQYNNGGQTANELYERCVETAHERFAHRHFRPQQNGDRVRVALPVSGIATKGNRLISHHALQRCHSEKPHRNSRLFPRVPAVTEQSY